MGDVEGGLVEGQGVAGAQLDLVRNLKKRVENNIGAVFLVISTPHPCGLLRPPVEVDPVLVLCQRNDEGQGILQKDAVTDIGQLAAQACKTTRSVVLDDMISNPSDRFQVT